MWGQFISFAESYAESAAQTLNSTADVLRETAGSAAVVLLESAGNATSIIQTQIDEILSEAPSSDVPSKEASVSADRFCLWNVADEAKTILVGELKDRIEAISKSESNFVCLVPDDEAFPFDMTKAIPYAEDILKRDESLAQMRFLLVPRKIKEDEFWKIYFYQVFLIREELGVDLIPVTSAEISSRNSSPSPVSSFRRTDDVPKATSPIVSPSEAVVSLESQFEDQFEKQLNEFTSDDNYEFGRRVEKSDAADVEKDVTESEPSLNLADLESMLADISVGDTPVDFSEMERELGTMKP